MRAINPIAWATLVESERTALSLKFSVGKSTWEAGEIMKRSHYKYLEIESRAKFFLKMFTEQVELFGSIIPEFVPFEVQYIRTYLEHCIIKRLKPSTALDLINEKREVKIKKANLDQNLIKQLKIWNDMDEPYGHTLYHLCMEFDRWNNFRILPKEIQEPSPYKRRAKKVFRAQLRILKTMPAISTEKIKKIFGTKRAPCLFLPLIMGESIGEVIKIKTNPTYLQSLDGAYLYYFENQDDAKAYLQIVMDYIYNNNRSCKDGLQFWPKFRDVVKLAKNYNQIHNLTPNRKFLQMALNKIEFF